LVSPSAALLSGWLTTRSSVAATFAKNSRSATFLKSALPLLATIWPLASATLMLKMMSGSSRPSALSSPRFTRPPLRSCVKRTSLSVWSISRSARTTCAW
jgi:hypothetical protein